VSARNLRLLGDEKSPLWQPSLQEIIAELQAELSKGEQVYSPEELRHLERKLADYEQMLTTLLNH
jgi:hypothetical protein